MMKKTTIHFREAIRTTAFLICFTFYFLSANSIWAQVETEPNDSATASGTQRIWQGTTITGTVKSGDYDYWNISKLPGFDPQDFMALFVSSGYDPNVIQIEYSIKEGSYTGTDFSPFSPLQFLSTTGGLGGYPTAQAGWYFLINNQMAANDHYVVMRITTTSVTDMNYSLVLESTDFPACTTPANVTGLTTSAVGVDLQLNNFAAVAGISGGYIVEISDSPTFTDLPDPQFDVLTSATPSTVYSGSGQQIVYASPTPIRLASGFQTPATPGNLRVTGLGANQTYYFRVTTVNECNGYFNFSSGTIVSGTTFVCTNANSAPSSQVTGITTANNTVDTFNISSFTPPTGGATGYVVKVNTANSFTAPTDGNLPTASTTYNSGAGEQVVYAGTSTTPNLTISGTGVTPGATFYVKVYAYNTCEGNAYFESTGTTVTRSICNGAPTVIPEALTIDQNAGNSVRVNSPGAGGAQGRVIFINTTNSFTAPSTGALPTVNTAYSGSGQQAILIGSSINQNAVVTGLTPGTQYYFRAYAYDACGSNYYFGATGRDANAVTCGPVNNIASNAVFYEVGDTFMDLNSFSPAAGVSGYVVKMNTVNTFSPPTDGLTSLPSTSTAYSGGEQVIYAGTSTTPDIRITGLSAATTYYFAIYSYTSCNGTLYYEQAGYKFSRENVNPPSNLAFNDFSVTYGAVDFDLNNFTTTLSTGTRTYSIVSGGTSSGSAITGAGSNIMDLGSAGTVIIQVSQAAGPGYNAATAQATMTINKANPVITFENITVTPGTAAFTLTATPSAPVGAPAGTATPTGAISYSFVGDANGNALSGTNNSTLTPGTTPGSVTLRASVATDTNYNAASQDALFTITAPSQIFSADPNSFYRIDNESSLTTLYNLSTAPAVSGSATTGLENINGQYWGVAANNGPNNSGTLFKVDSDGTNFTVVKAFDAGSGVGHSGRAPQGRVLFYDNKIWGTTTAGGTNNGGTIYSVDTDGQNYTVIHNFDAPAFGTPNSSSPYSGLTLVNGKLWGTFLQSSGGFEGGVYRIDPDGSNYEVLHTFTALTHPYGPLSKLVVANNKVWGTTIANPGSIFNFNTDGTGYKEVQVISGSQVNSFAGIRQELTLVGTQLWGTSSTGGNNGQGVIFRINTDETGYTEVHHFTSTGSRSPVSALALDGTVLYGMTSVGGANGFGTVFRINTDGTGYTDIFDNTVSHASFKGLTLSVTKQRLTPGLLLDNQTVEHQAVINLSVTTNSTGAITYSLVGDTTGSSISGNQFTAGNVGTVTVRANLAQDSNFEAAQVDATFTISKTNPTFTLPTINTTFGAADIALAPTATNYPTASIVYEFVDPNNNVNTRLTGYNTTSVISGTTLNVGSQGSETIRATFPGNSNFNTATTDFNLVIGEGVADLTDFQDFSMELLQSDLTLSIPSASGVAVSYQLVSGGMTGTSLSGTNNEIVTVGNNTGTETIRVTVNQANYASTTKDVTLTVTKASQVITFNSLANSSVGAAPFELTASSTNSAIPITYTSSNTAVATVSGSTVTVVGKGTTNITASQAGDATYAAATDVMQSLTVDVVIQDRAVSVSPSSGICSVDAVPSVTASQNAVTYYLRDNSDNTVIEVKEGNGANISFAAETLTANKTYNVLAVEDRLNTLQFGAANTNGYVEIPNTINNQFSGNRITVETWAYIPSSDNGDQYSSLVADAFTGDGTVKFQVTNINGKIEAGFYNGAWTVTPTISANTSPPKDRWVHIAATYDQSNIILYFNGVEVSRVGSSATLPTSSTVWHVGRRWDSALEAIHLFGGSLADTRIWNVAKSPTEIQASMHNQIETSTGLVASYTYDATSGTTLVDKTGNGFEGTLTNLPGNSTNWVKGANTLAMTATPTVTINSIANQAVNVTQPTGQSAVVSITSSEVGVNYSLRNNVDNTVLAGPIAGTGSQIIFPLQQLFGADRTFNIYAEGASSSGCNRQMDTTPTAMFEAPNAGNSGGMWSSPGTWSSGSVPTMSSPVQVGNGSTITVDIDNAEASSVDIVTGGTLNIDNTKALTIENGFQNSGTVSITSLASNSGVLLVKGSATGTVTYERGGFTANAWSLVTAPVAGQKIKDFVENSSNDIRINTTVTPNRYAVAYYDDSQPTGSKWVYYDVDFLTANPDTEFEIGRSYAMSRATDGSVSFTGTLEVSNVNKSVTASQWNAIGNPFTAFIPANQNSNNNFISDNTANFDPTNVAVYVWESSQSRYVARSLADAEATAIPPGQGFFIRTNTGVSSVSFNEDKRITQPASGDTTFKNSSSTPSIQLKATKNDLTIDTNIKYFDHATLGLDPGYDVASFGGNNFDIYTKLLAGHQDIDFTIQSLPTENYDSMVIPVGLMADASDQIIFTAEVLNFPTGVDVYLEDRETNHFEKLSDQGASYQVTLAEDISGTGRFYLHTTSNVLSDGPELSLQGINVFTTTSENLRITGVENERAHITLYNILGTQVFTQSFEGRGTNDIFIPRLRTGIYIVHLETETGRMNKKIVIE